MAWFPAFRRQESFRVALKRQPVGIGIRAVYSPNGRGLVIEDVMEAPRSRVLV